MRRQTSALITALTIVCALALVATTPADKIVAGECGGGGGGGAGGGMKLVGSIPASPAGKSLGGAYKLTGGFIAAAQVCREGTLSLESIASAGSGVVSALAAVPTAGGGQVTFTLSNPATVEFRILNIAGRVVRTVTPGQECEAGLNSFTWTGLSDTGLRAPNGRYLVEVCARTASGSQSRAVTSLQVAR